MWSAYVDEAPPRRLKPNVINLTIKKRENSGRGVLAGYVVAAGDLPSVPQPRSGDPLESESAA